ncbi:unnamed protein product [Dibothriocephalus latus]|uniref:Uncharacterized protein n=1 Tax=Dibothriocephalus latus TaxID=60516 RepID=A0A3P6RWM0_DIBLA|nr:unnamed protein product [Dibothriocephalus latus]
MRWHLAATDGEDRTWILQLNNSEACQICYNGYFENGMDACLQCHKPLAAQLKHLSHCRDCLSAWRPHRSDCHLCFLEPKHMVRTTLCRLNTEVKTAIERMNLYAKEQY